MRKLEIRKRLKQAAASVLAALILSMSFVPCLPGNLTSYGFGLMFVNSGTPGSPYLKGRVEGEDRESWFLCLNHGAAANSHMDYSKINADIDYAKGTLEQKKLFWAYIGAWGSYDGDSSIKRKGYPGSIHPAEAKRIAWKEGENAWVNQKIDEFAMLDHVPEGAKSAQEVLETVMGHNTPETAVLLQALLESPGVISKEKLFETAGVKTWDYFKEYCDMEAIPYEYNGKIYAPQVIEGNTGLMIQWLEADTGLPPAAGELKDHPPVTIKVTYNPSVFKVLTVSGRIEYFKARKSDGSLWPGAQQLVRVKGHVEEMCPVFYITTGTGGGQVILPDSGRDEGNLEDGEGVAVIIYQHMETFESNYQVELTKKDYETGYPLENAVFRVLEAFPDQIRLGEDETGGRLAETKMREPPVTWKNWLIFEDDMKTDENGYISHSDQRYYDFRHTYCNGHPEPEPPDISADATEEEEADAMAEYEALMEEWRAAVNECEEAMENSRGTHHHWVVGGTSAAGEKRSFEGSGCKDARDAAYENFINLRYSYTFQEVEARNGYIIHGQNGHPDDVPVEIITTASSEAGRSYEWTQCSNEEILVEGYARDYLSEDSKEKMLVNSISGQPMKQRMVKGSWIFGDRQYVEEDYDLSLKDRAVQALRRFIGLPKELASQDHIVIHVTAEYDEVSDFWADGEALKNDLAGTATPSEADENVEEKQEEYLEEDLTATSSSAIKNLRATASDLEEGEQNHVSDFHAARRRETKEEAAVVSGKKGGYLNLESPIQDSQPDAEPGPDDQVLHSWMVYDHRVPGQIHINKRDMELTRGESEKYDAYGDTQGDATLEGAVYGLFAADPIYGPDTQRNSDGTVKKGTGIIFDANDLVAVAATDKNGDASFLVITEKPHSIYNYETGQIQFTGKEYPRNLYDMDGFRKEYEEEETGRIYRDNVAVNGDWWIGRPLILGNYYIKELTRSEGYELSITGKNLEGSNATDETRNNYGATEVSESHPVGTAWIEQKLVHAVTFPEANEAYGNRENLLSVEIHSNGTTNGFDVVFDGIPEGAEFYFDNVTISRVTVQIPAGGRWIDAKEAPFYETARDASVSKRDQDGNPILNPDAVKDFPVLYNGIGYEAEKMTGEQAVLACPAEYRRRFTDTEENFRYVKFELEQMLRQMGVDTPYDGGYSSPEYSVFDETKGEQYGMPEFTIKVDMVTTNQSLIDAVLNYFVSKEVYTYGSLQQIELEGTTAKVRIAVGMNPKKTLLYRKNEAGEITNAYLFKRNESEKRYVMREYEGDSIVANALLGNSGRYQIYLKPDFIVDENGMPQNVYTYRPGTEFLKYDTGDVIYDYWFQDETGAWAGHEPVRRKVYETIYEEQEIEQTDVSSSRVVTVGSREEVKDPTGSTYVYYDNVSKQYILHAGVRDAGLFGEKVSGFTIALPDGSKTITEEDLNKIGRDNVWGYQAGDSLPVSEYLVRIQGAGAGVHTAVDFDKNTSFIKNQCLIYNGNHNLLEDGNTCETPNPVEERVITQTIKVAKTIQDTSYNNTNSYGAVHEDWFTKTFGGFFGTKKEALKMDNFRFKVYLKSNLERLFRDEDGRVVWLDRTGAQTDPVKEKRAFPALVNKFYTRAPHKAEPLYKDSQDGITANPALYSHTDGQIQEKQNQGYTAILETQEIPMEDGQTVRMIEALNYEKFFDGISVANHDKWDDAAPSYTSWKPVGNQINRNENTIQNTKASDRVRQFAIDWYLDDEVKKRVRAVSGYTGETEDKNGQVKYSDQLYDEALRAAIQKAENYLKPFFLYDLDEIYAVAWDSAENGGKDHDPATLSADILHGDEDYTSDGYFYGTSLRLPYGTYVVVEQQPEYAGLEDFKNRHYQIDKPKEVILPAAYAGYEASQKSPEVMNDFYKYSSKLAHNEMEWRYKIRFYEEPLHLIKGRNAQGDFEVYKYGMALERIRNGITGIGAGDYFALTQSEFKPYKNYYNLQDDRRVEDVTYYLSEGLSGRKEVSRYYCYSSVSERQGMANQVPFPGGTETEANLPGRIFKDQVVTMQGEGTAYEGKYAPMLVPWSMGSPENAKTEKTETTPQENGESSYKGYAYAKLQNRFFTDKLRVEKLDSETHENILHDGAIFNIYAAERDDSPGGEGKVRFYEEDTSIAGSKEFLTAMGAEDIRPVKRRVSFIERIIGTEAAPETLYTGIVRAGTPICKESQQIYLGDAKGNHTVVMKSYPTVRDGLMKAEEGNAGYVYADQTVGYLETPQPLGAGVYVIAEVKPPAGYMRSRPVALEVYSDRITYYKDGNKDKRVAAAVYEYPSDNPTITGNKPQDRITLSRIHIENEPICLETQKLKETGTVTFPVSGRVDGSLAEIGGNPDYEYAYENGVYLGYGWHRGTLEKLAELKAAGAQVEIVYQGNTFAGYGYVTQMLETDDDTNPYVVGAVMTLFDAIELHPSGDTEDRAFEGLEVERDRASNVIRMYVKKGFAGTRTDFVKETDEQGRALVVSWQAGTDSKEQPVEKEGNVWTAQTTERPDTDILYYDLGGLDILTAIQTDGQTLYCGYDRNHKKVQISQMESDRRNQEKLGTSPSLFAFRDSIPYLEITGGDFTKLTYSAKDKIITVAEGTRIYHLDRDGIRDSLVDPYTGMAYVEMPDKGVMVWPVHLRRDEHGNIIARDKITTFRIAAAGEAQKETTYLTGSWKADNQEESHHKSSVIQNKKGQSQNEEVLIADHNGAFEKGMNPVYDSHGLPVYYQQSRETYNKSEDLYDRDGTFVRQQDSDYLGAYNDAGYQIKSKEALEDGEENMEGQNRNPLYHRQGENYILENTWISSEKTPNDPFDTKMTDGQPDLLKRVPAGCYIMEELKCPAGYSKGMPEGIHVGETGDVQKAVMTDQTVKVMILKTDSPDLDKTDWVREPKQAFSWKGVKGATLALFPAKRVYTNDTHLAPSGYYLEKVGEEPLTYCATESTESSPEILTAQWTTSEAGVYLEGIPAGDYLLEEVKTPEGYVTGKPMEVMLTETSEVQVIEMADDHTHIEIEKYTMDGRNRKPVGGAEFSLYEAKVDGNGKPVFENGVIAYQEEKLAAAWVTAEGGIYQDFIPAFEAMYRRYGTMPGTKVSWDSDGVLYQAKQISCRQLDASVSGGGKSIWPTSAVMEFEMEDGRVIRIGIYGERAGTEGNDFTFEYQFDYRRLPEINSQANQYQTADGCQRLEYLPVGHWYALVETAAPEGYAAAEPKAVFVKNQAEVQHYEVENTAGVLLISKVTEKMDAGELAGAHLGLYRPGADGELVWDEAHLVTQWITGEDGVYSELDEVNGRIPDGYKVGDLRPHRIQGLPEGRYWLAENRSPDYYTACEPVLIEHSMKQMVQVIRVQNVPAAGKVTIRKTDKTGNLLSGALFELRAYEPGNDREPVLTQQLYGKEGVFCVENLPVGKILADGQIEPYHYKLRELLPPDGYGVNTRIFSWKFSPDKNGESYGFGEKAEQEITVEDEKTRIIINKKLAGAEGGGEETFVEGAHLAICSVNGYDAKGQVQYDRENPKLRWITSAEQADYVAEGLTAGRSYVLVEEQAPPGYSVMKPVLFTLAADGRSIASVGNSMSRVTVTFQEEKDDWPNEEQNVGRIQYLTVQGRVPLRSVLEADGANTMRERTFYSDGTSQITRQITQTAVSGQGDDTESMSLSRRPEATELFVETADNQVIESFRPQAWKVEHRISNEDGLFLKGETYIVREDTVWSDGSRMETDRIAFTLGEAGAECRVMAVNRKTQAELSKQEITGQQEIPGCEMEVADEGGNVVDRWISGENPHKITGVLETGKSYWLRERRPAEGYAFAEEILFTVNEDGVSQQVIMRDEKTRIEIWKQDQKTGRALAGAEFQILNSLGEEAGLWVSDGKPWRLEGILRAGETYTLREIRPPDGYRRMEDRQFTVPEYPGLVTIICENLRKTEEFEKPETSFRIGTVTAVYEPGQPRAVGWLYLGGSKRLRIPLPGTGQSSDGWWYKAGFFLSFGLLLAMWLFGKKNKKRKKEE